jgi:hypothetical protein
MARRPAWDPAGPLLGPGESLLLWSEQVLGASLPFKHYCQALQRSLGRDLIFCPPDPPVELARRSGVAERGSSHDEAAALGVGRWFPLPSVPGPLGVIAVQPLVNQP